MLLSGKGGEQHVRRGALARVGVDRRAQCRLQLLGVKVLLEHLQLPRIQASPTARVSGVAVSRTKRCTPCPSSRLARVRCSPRISWPCNNPITSRSSAGAAASRRVSTRASASALSSSSEQSMRRPGRIPTSIKRLMARSLATSPTGILALAVIVAARLGEGIAPFPHPQDVLRQAGLPLDCRDVESHAEHRHHPLGHGAGSRGRAVRDLAATPSERRAGPSQGARAQGERRASAAGANIPKGAHAASALTTRSTPFATRSAAISRVTPLCERASCRRLPSA